MKRRKIDLINILKYGMVLVFVIYIIFLVSSQGGNDVTVKTISENILKVTKTEGMTKGTTQDLKKYYGLNSNDFDGVMLYIPDDVMSVNEILVVKLKDRSQAEEVEKAVENRKNTQKNSFEGYGVQQTKLINSSVMVSRGYYVLFTISEDADAIYEAFKKSI
ncbi:MAG: DUF4358 domain-containing protein [Dorea sp.]